MTRTIRLSALAVTALLAVAAAPDAEAQQQSPMTFFIASVGKGNGADLGGLDGADAHCAALAKTAGSTIATWRAYLSTTAPAGNEGVNARDRIGKGPWPNAKGMLIAKSVDDLHSDGVSINKQTALTEKGEVVTGSGETPNKHDILTGSGETPNKHDILTGSDPDGRYSTAGGDTTCGNWTKSAEGSAIVGHHDRIGLKKTTRHMRSWNSSHGSRGCSQDLLKASGGAGLLYCFAAR
ncbi:MAG: hypothetical protein WAN86_17715 [Hyphomicrobiaceae bacterium]